MATSTTLRGRTRRGCSSRLAAYSIRAAAFTAHYNANWPFLRWPIDQVFFENSFTLLEMRRLGYIGSDHLPLYVALCQRPDAAPHQPEPQPAAEDLRRAREQIQEARKDAESPD